MQAALQVKRRKLQILHDGAAAVMQAASAPCTDLKVSEVQPPRTEQSTSQTMRDLPQPLYVLADELRLVQQLYKLPIEVRTHSSSDGNCCVARAPLLVYHSSIIDARPVAFGYTSGSVGGSLICVSPSTGLHAD